MQQLYGGGEYLAQEIILGTVPCFAELSDGVGKIVVEFVPGCTKYTHCWSIKWLMHVAKLVY